MIVPWAQYYKNLFVKFPKRFLGKFPDTRDNFGKFSRRRKEADNFWSFSDESFRYPKESFGYPNESFGYPAESFGYHNKSFRWPEKSFIVHTPGLVVKAEDSQ